MADDEIKTRIIGSMKGRDLAFIDIETTGLDPRKHEIIEIAVLRVSQEWTPENKPVFIEKSLWTTRIKPTHLETADTVSLKISGYTATLWKEAISIQEALIEFAKKTEGAIMVAHNVAFDAGFLDTHLALHEIQNLMHYHRLDTVSMAYAKLHNDPLVARYSLNELCKYFGIVNENPHTAPADVRADFELFKKLILL